MSDEGRNQTLVVVKRTLLGAPTPVAGEEIELWLDFQRWLEIDAPDDVAAPFAAAIYKACYGSVCRVQKAVSEVNT